MYSETYPCDHLPKVAGTYFSDFAIVILVWYASLAPSYGDRSDQFQCHVKYWAHALPMEGIGEAMIVYQYHVNTGPMPSPMEGIGEL